MTTIILTIIGILLAAAAALMVVWYGGDAYDSGVTKARAAQLLDGVVQIAHAARLYEIEQGSKLKAATPHLLLDRDYLTRWPASPGANLFFLDRSGCAGCTVGDVTGVVFATPDAPEARRICEAVERGLGHAAPCPFTPRIQTMLDAMATHSQGCSTDGASIFVYSRI